MLGIMQQRSSPPSIIYFIWYIPMAQRTTKPPLSSYNHSSGVVLKTQSIVGFLQAMVVLLYHDWAYIQNIYIQSLGSKISGQRWISDTRYGTFGTIGTIPLMKWVAPQKQLFLTALKREAPNIFKDVLQDSPVDATFYLK